MMNRKSKFQKRCVSPVLLMVLFFGSVTAQNQQPQVNSPEIHDDKSVTFRLLAPDAEEVSLHGSWMADWNERRPLSQNEEGVWVTTIENLAPEYYTYSYYSNGLKVLDPHNALVTRDGRNHFSGFLLRGDHSELYSIRDVPKGTVSEIWYPSPTLNKERRMVVYTPPGYDQSSDEYFPVLYLLHGGGGDEKAWMELGLANRILDNLIAEGRAESMLVIMTNGNPNQTSSWHNTPGYRSETEEVNFLNTMANHQFERSLALDVIPFIEANFRVKTGKENRAVTGLSMGGLQTQRLAYHFPELFNYYGVMSMGVIRGDAFGVEAEELIRQTTDKMAGLNEIGYELYWIACGTDDFLYDSVLHMIEIMNDNEFEYIYRESDGGHTWDRWRLYLSEFVPMLFK